MAILTQLPIYALVPCVSTGPVQIFGFWTPKESYQPMIWYRPCSNILFLNTKRILPTYDLICYPKLHHGISTLCRLLFPHIFYKISSLSQNMWLHYNAGLEWEGCEWKTEVLRKTRKNCLKIYLCKNKLFKFQFSQHYISSDFLENRLIVSVLWCRCQICISVIKL